MIFFETKYTEKKMFEADPCLKKLFWKMLQNSKQNTSNGIQETIAGAFLWNLEKFSELDNL